MTEWLKVLAWKAGVQRETVPRVRIPLSPHTDFINEKLTKF